MSEQCDKIRHRLPEFVLGGLAQSEEKEITGHLAECGTCSRYEKALRSDHERLKNWAGEVQTSLAGMEDRVMGALERRVQVKPPSGKSMWRWIIPQNTRQYVTISVGIAAIILVFSYFLGVFEGSAPVLADVLNKIYETKSVSYSQSYNTEGSDPFTTEVIAVEPGLVRTEMPFGSVLIMDYNSGKSINLYPTAKLAILTQRTGAPELKQPYNYLEWIRNLHRNSGVFARKGFLDEEEMNVFVIEHDEYKTTTVWADVETDLPVRIEFNTLPNPNKEIVVPEITLKMADFGGPPGYSETVSESGGSGINQRSTIVKDNFRWNVAVEDSLFRLTPPEGYTVKEMEHDVSSNEEQDLVESLAFWAETAGNTFPERINDLCDIEKVKPLLVAKFDEDGDPEDEFDQAVAMANKLVGGLYFAQEKKSEGAWHYAGADVRYGDAKTPLCWWQLEDSENYRVIYGDLHTDDVAAADLPVAQKPEK
jgi:outer membrane lipoprotein-sorting protein